MFVSPGLFWALGVTQASCTLLIAATAQEGRGSERALPGPGGYGVPKDFPVEPCFCRTPLCLRTLWMPEELSCMQTHQRREGVKRYGECRGRAQPLGHHSLSSSATHGPDIPHTKQEHGSGSGEGREGDGWGCRGSSMSRGWNQLRARAELWAPR